MGRISLNLEFPLFYYQIRSVYGILYQKYLLISRNLCNEVNVQEEELIFIARYRVTTAVQTKMRNTILAFTIILCL